MGVRTWPAYVRRQVNIKPTVKSCSCVREPGWSGGKTLGLVSRWPHGSKSVPLNFPLSKLPFINSCCLVLRLVWRPLPVLLSFLWMSLISSFCHRSPDLSSSSVIASCRVVILSQRLLSLSSSCIITSYSVIALFHRLLALSSSSVIAPLFFHYPLLSSSVIVFPSSSSVVTPLLRHRLPASTQGLLPFIQCQSSVWSSFVVWYLIFWFLSHQASNFGLIVCLFWVCLFVCFLLAFSPITYKRCCNLTFIILYTLHRKFLHASAVTWSGTKQARNSKRSLKFCPIFASETVQRDSWSNTQAADDIMIYILYWSCLMQMKPPWATMSLPIALTPLVRTKSPATRPYRPRLGNVTCTLL